MAEITVNFIISTPVMYVLFTNQNYTSAVFTGTTAGAAANSAVLDHAAAIGSSAAASNQAPP